MFLGGAFHWEGVKYLKAHWPYHFVLQSLGPGTSKNELLANRTRRRSVWQNELRETEWQVFVDKTISDRKQLMENMATHRHMKEHASNL